MNVGNVQEPQSETRRAKGPTSRVRTPVFGERRSSARCLSRALGEANRPSGGLMRVCVVSSFEGANDDDLA